MVRRYEVMDEQWKIIEPHLENKAKRTERPQVDNRKLFNGVLWILREREHHGEIYRNITDRGRPCISVLLNGKRMEN